MYCSWTGRICIFITAINFPDNNRHTTVFHEKAYFSTIMEYFLQDIIAPRMSSHCYKLFDLFSFDFSHKTVVFGWRTLYCCHKISGEDVMSLSQNFILGSLQHIPYQRSLSYYHFLINLP